MPRRPAGRSIDAERRVRLRVAREREARDWSYETLSNEMADVGCPIAASALHRIEKGDPPRKISLDEFVAFADVFEIDRDELLRPLDPTDEEARIVAQLEKVREPGEEYIRLLLTLSAENPDRAQAEVPAMWSKFLRYAQRSTGPSGSGGS